MSDGQMSAKEIARALERQYGVPADKARRAALRSTAPAQPAVASAGRERAAAKAASMPTLPGVVAELHVRFEWSTVRITLPAPETLTNSGKGRSRNQYVVNRRKKAYFRQLDELLTAKLITAPPRRPMPRAWITSRMYIGGQMDTDNAMARHKWPIDWLATRGYIANDRHLKWSGFPEQIIKRDGDCRLELTIDPIPE